MAELADPAQQPAKAEMNEDSDVLETNGRRRSGGAAPE